MSESEIGQTENDEDQLDLMKNYNTVNTLKMREIKDERFVGSDFPF